MLDAHEVKEKLALVAKDKLSVNAFENWLVPNSWDMHRDSSPEVVDLVSSIELIISERNERLLNRSEFRQQLVGLFYSLPQDLIYAPVPVVRPAIVMNYGAQWSNLAEFAVAVSL